MLQDRPVGCRETRQRTNLIYNIGLDFFARGVNGPPSKADQIRKAWMSADADSAFFASLHGMIHDSRISGMETACDIRGGYEIKQSLVITHPVLSKTFPYVRDQVHGLLHLLPPGTVRQPAVCTIDRTFGGITGQT